MKNLIQDQLTCEEKDKANELISGLENLFFNKLKALTEKERGGVKAINEKNKLLVNKIRDYSQHSQSLRSPDVDWKEFESDYEARVFLEQLMERLNRLSYQVESTKMLHDNDNYDDALIDYAFSQYSKGAGKPGFTEKVAELKQFFPRSKRIVSDDSDQENDV